MTRINPFWCGPNPCEWHCEEGPLVCKDYVEAPFFEPGLPKWDILAESGTWEVTPSNYLRLNPNSSIKLRLKFTAPTALGRNLHGNMSIRAEPGGSVVNTRQKVWTCADSTLTNGHWAELDNTFTLSSRTLSAGASTEKYSYTFFDTPSFAGVIHCVCDGWPGYSPPFDSPYAYVSSATVLDNYVVDDESYGVYMGFECYHDKAFGYTDIESMIFRPILFAPNDPDPSICHGCTQT